MKCEKCGSERLMFRSYKSELKGDYHCLACGYEGKFKEKQKDGTKEHN